MEVKADDDAAPKQELGTTQAAVQQDPSVAGLQIPFKERPQLLMMYGRQHTGKSALCKALAYQCAKAGVFDWMIVYTATSWNDHYRSFLPEHAVRVWKQDEFYELYGKIRAFKRAHPDKPLSRGCVIVDDCLGQQKLYDPRFLNIISTYRHYNTDIWQTQQLVSYGASTLQRTMLDYAFMFRATDDQSVRFVQNSRRTLPVAQSIQEGVSGGYSAEVHVPGQGTCTCTVDSRG